MDLYHELIELIVMRRRVCDAPVSCLRKGWFKIMPQVAPWNSKKEQIHHNNTNCNTGNNIEVENKQSGTGGKPLCKECERLNREGR